ncbi:MAG: diguanylate cyclase [Deltaproteobacteria bacterium]|nr:MAG: diguanylate cyclase [Deltaproteobacteria bacterium]
MPGRIGGYRQLRNGLEYEFRRAQRYDHPLSAILLAVAGYDEVLEKEGRKEAAVMISEMVVVMRECLRSVDRLYRIGKDQFIVVLPETSNEGARKALERLADKLRNPERKEFRPIEVVGKVVSFPDGEIQSAGDMLMKLGQERKPQR